MSRLLMLWGPPDTIYSKLDFGSIKLFSATFMIELLSLMPTKIFFSLILSVRYPACSIAEYPLIVEFKKLIISYLVKLIFFTIRFDIYL